MYSSRKRAREEDISIRVAAREPVAAESFILRALSSCARALPADAQEWDVSSLLLDGQPFSRETVSCWLQCVYHSVYCTALEADSISQLSTVEGLTQVLDFADAVGSVESLCKAACSQLQQLQFVLQLPEQTLEVPFEHICWFGSSNRQLTKYNLLKASAVGDPLASVEQVSDVQRQVAQQLAALLRLAHVLHLQPLLHVLHQFILLNTWPEARDAGGRTRLLSGVTGLVFSDAVCEAVLGSSSTLSKEAYVSSVLSQPCSLTPDAIGHGGLLRPTGPANFKADSQMLVFDAVLLRDFAGGRAGDKVNAKLDLSR